jgi:hypothetical protein
MMRMREGDKFIGFFDRDYYFVLYSKCSGKDPGLLKKGVTMTIGYAGDRNAFAILAFCQRIIEADGGDKGAYFNEATAGTYNDLLDVSARWTGVDFDAYYESDFVWLADDGSWGTGMCCLSDASLITPEEWEILEDGSDLDRQELFRSWFVKEE